MRVRSIVVFSTVCSLVSGACDDGGTSGPTGDDVTDEGGQFDVAFDVAGDPDIVEVSEDVADTSVDEGISDPGVDPDLADTADTEDLADTGVDPDLADTGVDQDLADTADVADLVDAGDVEMDVPCVDTDGDGRGPGCAEPDACPDDPDMWTSCDACVDSDGDEYFVGCDQYASRSGPDCAVDDPHRFTLVYLDEDGDLFGTGAGICGGWEGHLGRAMFDGDCDDTDPEVNPAYPDLPGDGIDNDCAGGDASLSDETGVFVDASAPAGGAGTQSSPLNTIAAGIEAAEALDPPKSVYVAAGDYGETLVTSVSVFGGYANAAGTWTRNPESNATRIEKITVGQTKAVSGRVIIDGLLFDSGAVGAGVAVNIPAEGNACDFVAISNNRWVFEPATSGLPSPINAGAGDIACRLTLIAANEFIAEPVPAATSFYRTLFTSADNVAIVGNLFEITSQVVEEPEPATITALEFAARNIAVIGNDFQLSGTFTGHGIRVSSGSKPVLARIGRNQFTISVIALGGSNLAISVASSVHEDSFFWIHENHMVAGVANGASALIERNYAEDLWAIAIHGGTQVVRNNVLVGHTGVMFLEGSGSVMNNTIHAERPVGLWQSLSGGYYWGFDEVNLVNNLLVSSGQYCVGAQSWTGSDVTADHYRFFHNSCAGASIGWLDAHAGGLTTTEEVDACAADQCIEPGAGNVMIPPTFAPESLYELTAPSGLIDGGVNPTTVNGGGEVPDDYEGTARPVDGDEVEGTAWDIGAYEYTP